MCEPVSGDEEREAAGEDREAQQYCSGFLRGAAVSQRRDVRRPTTDVVTIPLMAPMAVAAADHFVAFERPAVNGAPAVVVELRDAYRNLLARSIVETSAPKTEVAEQQIDTVQLMRCSDYVIDPIGRERNRRVTASVTPRESRPDSQYQRQRASAFRSS